MFTGTDNKTGERIELSTEKQHELSENFLTENLRADKELVFSFVRDEKIHHFSSKTFDFDFEKVVIETVFSRNKRRAEILVPNKEYQPFLGAGLIIEIQFNEQSSDRQWLRAKEHAMRGYSVAWIKPDHFTIEDGRIILTRESIIFSPSAHLHERIKEEGERDFRELVKQQSEVFTSLVLRSVDEMKQSQKLPQYGGHCPDCHEEHGGVLMLKTVRDNVFYGCSRYPTCTGRKNLRDDAFT